jgi:hypothetical protein
MFPLRYATAARRVIFLQATVNLFRDSQLAWILPFGFWLLHVSTLQGHLQAALNYV